MSQFACLRLSDLWCRTPRHDSVVGPLNTAPNPYQDYGQYVASPSKPTVASSSGREIQNNAQTKEHRAKGQDQAVGDSTRKAARDEGERERRGEKVEEEESEVPTEAIRGTEGNEELDPSYHKRRNPRRFFVFGRVFAILFPEPLGAVNPSNVNSVFRVSFNEQIYTSIRRFVVVQERRGFCYACPISTYGGRATLKPGLNPKDHAVVYTTDKLPFCFEDETGMDKEPIGVYPTGYNELHRASRINFAIHHPIQHNVKVKDLGMVCEDHMPKLEAYWRIGRGY